MAPRRPQKIRRVLVANRGEIAVRIFHTCRELGLGTVAVYSDADADAPHRFAADEAVPIGPAPASESYLNSQAILEAATRSGANAIHPGYGFLSENAAFAQTVEDAGLCYIGPTPRNVEEMGDKLRARDLMRRAGVPVIPGTDAPVTNEKQLASLAARIGFPLLVKAAGGGGGKGIRRVTVKRELADAWRRATSEAGSAFSDSRVYLERLIPRARHVEAQIFGDGKGGALFLGERECSLQRHHQKLLEESPSPAIDGDVRTQIRDAALAGVRAIRYRGAGTLEFLYDEERKEFYFLEMNTRLQVEHPVTEMVTRRDLVEEQLRIADGGDLDGVEEPVRRGAAIEFRVYAEDPFRGFVPSTGRVESLRLPHAPFTRIDAALREGYEISPYYDPLLAKVIAWGADRTEAIRRLKTLLSRTRIGGIHTTIPLGVQICNWPAFVAGSFHTASLEEWLDRSFVPTEPPPLAVRLAGIVAREAASPSLRPRRPIERRDGGTWGRVARFEGTGGER